jgi:simple sugar transport system permease protein
MAESVLSDTPDTPSPHVEEPSEPKVNFLAQVGRLAIRQREASVFVVVVILFIYFSIASSNTFISLQNVQTIAQYVAPYAIMATGEVFLLICGEIDISIGSVWALTPFVMYALNQNGLPVWLSILIALLMAAGIGLLNGVVTVWLKIPSLITTLGTQLLALGLTLTISSGEPVIPPDTGGLTQILGGSPYSEIIWAIGLMVVFQIVLSWTRWGMHTVATGGNLLGASESGVNVSRIKIVSFMICSLLGGLVGVMESFRIKDIDPLNGGTTAMFTAVAGAVIGGTALNGGIGTIVGAFLGVLALQTINDGFTLLGISAYVYYLIEGAAILVAMILNLRLRFWREGKR